MSKARDTPAGTRVGSAHATRYRSTSPVAIGWMRVCTQRALGLAGWHAGRWMGVEVFGQSRMRGPIEHEHARLR
jgi:hypothetical protein